MLMKKGPLTDREILAKLRTYVNHPGRIFLTTLSSVESLDRLDERHIFAIETLISIEIWGLKKLLLECDLEDSSEGVGDDFGIFNFEGFVENAKMAEEFMRSTAN